MNIEKLKLRWQREDEHRIDSAVSKFIADAEGRKFLWWLLEIGRVATQPYANNALQTAFNCGELNIGQRILDRIIFVAPEGYLLMMQENNNERRERDAQLDLIVNGMEATADQPGTANGETAPRA